MNNIHITVNDKAIEIEVNPFPNLDLINEAIFDQQEMVSQLNNFNQEILRVCDAVRLFTNLEIPMDKEDIEYDKLFLTIKQNKLETKINELLVKDELDGYWNFYFDMSKNNLETSLTNLVNNASDKLNKLVSQKTVSGLLDGLKNLDLTGLIEKPKKKTTKKVKNEK